MKEDLVEIHPKVFLNRQDPDFYRKAFRYSSYNTILVLKFADQLESDGKTDKAYEFYKKAERLGSAYARSKLNQIEKLPPRLKARYKNEKPKTHFWLGLGLFFLFIEIGLLSLLLF